MAAPHRDPQDPQDPQDPHDPHDPHDPGRGSRVDRPPYAWLDDPAQPFGPVSIGVTVAMGALLGGLGLFSVTLGLVQDTDARGARLSIGLGLVLLGSVITRMGAARRAWRLRNPGRDPLVVATGSGANVGSPLGDESWTGRIGRWVLVAVCGAVVLVMALALRRAATGQTPTSVGGVAVIVLLGLFAAGVGALAVRRPPRRRR